MDTIPKPQADYTREPAYRLVKGLKARGRRDPIHMREAEHRLARLGIAIGAKAGRRGTRR